MDGDIDERDRMAGAAREVEIVSTAPSPTTAAIPGAFTHGSILRHVLIMTGTSAIGIMAIFVVDLLSLFYIARLGQTTLTAAVGYATQILFYPISINIGLTIAVTALVSRALGAGHREDARCLAASGVVYAILIAALVAAGLLMAVDPILASLGARGEVAEVAARFLWITVPANVLFAPGIALSGVLRAVGDARRAMYVTLIGAVVTGLLDPVLIFGLGLGVYGAAISTVVSRILFLVISTWGAVFVHDLVARPTRAGLLGDLAPLTSIALPAVATNLATPVGNSFIFFVISRYGSEAVAATAITDRLVPVVFGALFALSGAVGPILGQNLGARLYGRVRETLATSCRLTTAYVAIVWALLWLATPLVLALFNATGDAAHYITFFCHVGVGAWLFIGFLFVANASFNNLGFPWLSLLFNWGRATLGTMPFVSLGAAYGGVIGAQLGVAAGAALFGTGAMVTAFRLIGRLAKPSIPQ